MKLKYGLALLLLLTGCSQTEGMSTVATPYDSTAPSSTTTSDVSSTLSSALDSTLDSTIETSSSPSSSTNNSTTSPSSSSSSNSSSSTTTITTTCTDNPGGTNPDGTTKMAYPCNKDSKVQIKPSSDGNVNAMEFDFEESLPSGFRHIYGNNFTNPSFYAPSAGGGVRFDQPRKGIQTPMFTTDQKLEIRLNIGSVNNNNKGNDIDKDLPVINIHGFDESGKLLRTESIETITAQDANKYKRVYMDGNDIAYLEFRLIQYAYKGSQAYNIAITGVSITAWIYPLD